MRTTVEWLDAVKRKFGLDSDYKLAKLLNVEPQNVSHYRAGRRYMDPYTAARVAELLKVDPLKVIAACESQRARDEEQRTFWKRLAACVVLGTATTVGTPPPPAAAATLHNGNYQGGQSRQVPDFYIHFARNRKRKSVIQAAADALTAAGSSIHRAAVWLAGGQRLA
jgi:transcriptional regulator with XRE-family HTH domain